MPTPFPHQLTGAAFLAERKAALLGDAPRVGKTGSSIIACDMNFARRVLVVTTASARAQWGGEFKSWGFPRNIQVVYTNNTSLATTRMLSLSHGVWWANTAYTNSSSRGTGTS